MVKIITTHGFSLYSVRKLEKQTESGRMRVRLMAVRLVWEGYPATAVSDILGITGETVRSYVASWNQGGLGALIPGKSPGKPPKIPPEIVEQLCPLLQQSPHAVGYGESANGDTRVFQAFLHDRYGIQMSRAGCTQWLHRHGFRWTRPTYVLDKADPIKQQAFVDALQELKKTDTQRSLAL